MSESTLLLFSFALTAFLMAPNVVFGQLPNGRSLPPIEDCYEKHIRYDGPSVFNESFRIAPDVHGCNRLCWDMNDCDYFAFNTQNNQCFLMGRNAIGGRRAAAYWISGPRTCSRPNTGCFDEMTLYQERILFTLRDVCSPEACQKLCADHPGCFFFMHHATTRVCRLMRGRSGTSIPRRRERFPFVSGPFSCFEPDQCEDGWSRFGNSCYRATDFAFFFANETKSACRFLRVDGAVPTEPRTQDQLAAVATLIEARNVIFDVWIGLEDSNGDGQYNWVSDGAPLDPSLANWAPPYPTPEGGCVSAFGISSASQREFPTSTWANNGLCVAMRVAICQYDLPPPPPEP